MKQTYFISDLHLGATYITDPRQHEQRVVAFLDSLIDRADELIMVGDVLDYWFEYRTVVPRGYVRFFGALARLADAGVKITWFVGNHDIWLFDYVRNEIGIEVIDGVQRRSIYGKQFFIAHGDGLGSQPRSFQLIRWLFRNRICQKMYASIHPRWTVPFAHRWSRGSRQSGGYFPDKELTQDPLYIFAADYCAAHPQETDFFVFGHEHKPILAEVMLPPSADTKPTVAIGPAGQPVKFAVLGDWISLNTYATFNGAEFAIHTFNQK